MQVLIPILEPELIDLHLMLTLEKIDSVLVEAVARDMAGLETVKQQK